MKLPDSDKPTYTEELAHLVLVLVKLAIAGTVCWFFKGIIVYILLSVFVTLLAMPLCNLICRIKVGKKAFPRWLGAIISIFAVLSVIISLMTAILPLAYDVIGDVSSANINNMAMSLSVPLDDLNNWIVRNVPNVGYDFRLESYILGELQGLLNAGTLSTVVGSLTMFLTDLGVALFSIIFISFFFIKKPGMISSIVCALIPDKYTEKARASMQESGKLVSRYFIGMAIEVLGVSLLNFIGLLLIARMGFKYSISIAFLTGLLNIIPYIGPLIGGVLGVSFSLVIKYVCASTFGLSVGFLPFVLILAGIFTFTQLVDNSIYQPLIYSNSVKVHPLEIFIVFLIAGHVGGMTGMFIAIPSYTVVRVIAKQFLGNVKAIRELTADRSEKKKS